MPRGEHLKGKKSMNPAARSSVPTGVHDGRFQEDRRSTKRYQYTEDDEPKVHTKFRRPLKGDIPVGSFEDWLIGNLDKQGVPEDLRNIQSDRARKNYLAKKFWEYLDEKGVTSAGD